MKLPGISEWASEALARADVSQAELSRRLVKDYRLTTVDRAAANKMLLGKRGISAEEMLAPFSTNPVHKPIFLRRSRDWEVVGRVRRTVLDL